MRAAAAVSRRWASLTESTVSMEWKSSTARVDLLDCNGPMRWYSASLRWVSGGGFGGELLDAVFTEETVAGGVGFEEELDGMDLGDGHEGDVGFWAVGAAAGVGHLFADAGEICFYGHACCILSV